MQIRDYLEYVMSHACMLTRVKCKLATYKAVLFLFSVWMLV